MRKCEHAKIINADALQEIYEDISGEFGTLGKLIDSFIVKKIKLHLEVRLRIWGSHN